MELNIIGKRVLITGGSKGIGAAIANEFSDEGCKVSLVARNEDQLQQTINKIGGDDGGHDYIVSDLMETGEPTRVAREIIAKYGTIDIVVHNVGGALGQKDPLGNVEDWNRVWQFNVGIAIEMNAVLIPEMKKQGWGRIVHMSSIYGAMGDQSTDSIGGSPAYAAAKAYPQPRSPQPSHLQSTPLIRNFFPDLLQ